MSPEGAQQAEQKKGPHRARKLREIPGLTAAIVAFVLVVLLGSGGVAIAMWNQSATATIAITAGASPKPSPTPTPSATPTPTVPPTTPPPVVPGGSWNITASPRIAARPAVLQADAVTCKVSGTSGTSSAYTFTWPADPSGDVSYVVSLSASDKNYGTPQTGTVTVNTARYTLANSQASYGTYMLRIQPMKGGDPGDAIYAALVHDQWDKRCQTGNIARISPLGTFSFRGATAPDVKQPDDNVVALSWTAATKATQNTKYVVTVTSMTTASSYGTEFTTATLGVSLTFPPRVWDAGGYRVLDANYFGEYKLRIQPIDGAQIGDPVYMTLQYNKNNFGYW